MKPLSTRELNTLLAMAQCAENIHDAADVLSAFSTLEPSHKKQLKTALKGLPAESKKLLRQAATQRKGVAA